MAFVDKLFSLHWQIFSGVLNIVTVIPQWQLTLEIFYSPILTIRYRRPRWIELTGHRVQMQTPSRNVWEYLVMYILANIRYYAILKSLSIGLIKNNLFIIYLFYYLIFSYLNLPFLFFTWWLSSPVFLLRTSSFIQLEEHFMYRISTLKLRIY